MYNEERYEQQKMLAEPFYFKHEDKRVYHNWKHVLENEEFLKSIEAPHLYFVANLWHDAIYDDKPFKEKRSADLFYRIYNGPLSGYYDSPEIDEIYRMIIETEDHVYNDESYLVEADLHQFAIEKMRLRNRRLLREEAFKLYGLDDDVEYAKNVVSFLSGLHDRVSGTVPKSTVDGIVLEISYSQSVIHNATV